MHNPPARLALEQQKASRIDWPGASKIESPLFFSFLSLVI